MCGKGKRDGRGQRGFRIMREGGLEGRGREIELGRGKRDGRKEKRSRD